MFLVRKFLLLSSFVPPILSFEFVAGFLDNRTEELTKRLRKYYKMVRIAQNKKVSGWIITARLLMGETLGHFGEVERRWGY